MTQTNDLSREMFVFFVLEEFRSRGMFGLSEDVVACVGTGAEAQEIYQGVYPSWYDDSDDEDGDGKLHWGIDEDFVPYLLPNEVGYVPAAGPWMGMGGNGEGGDDGDAAV